MGWGVGGCLTSNKWLEFGDDPDHEANRGIFKGFFYRYGTFAGSAALAVVGFRFLIMQFGSITLTNSSIEHRLKGG